MLIESQSSEFDTMTDMMVPHGGRLKLIHINIYHIGVFADCSYQNFHTNRYVRCYIIILHYTYKPGEHVSAPI
jgi:hypothetical protein